MKRSVPIQRKTPLKRSAPIARTTERRPKPPATKRARAAKASKIRASARGMPCMMRLPGCDGGGETTVLAHYRMVGYCGTGIKPDDFVFGAFACANCHDIADARRRADGMTKEEIRLAHAEAVFRTQSYLIEKGVAPHQPAPHQEKEDGPEISE